MESVEDQDDPLTNANRYVLADITSFFTLLVGIYFPSVTGESINCSVHLVFSYCCSSLTNLLICLLISVLLSDSFVNHLRNGIPGVVLNVRHLYLFSLSEFSWNYYILLFVAHVFLQYVHKSLILVTTVTSLSLQGSWLDPTVLETCAMHRSQSPLEQLQPSPPPLLSVSFNNCRDGSCYAHTPLHIQWGK